MIRLAALAFLALATACTELPQGQGTTPIRLTFPEMSRFEGSNPGPATRANSEMALDFMDLAFRMESGRELQVLSRFEGPVTVRVVGNLPRAAQADLSDLLQRLRREAGIDINFAQGSDANISIIAVPRRDLQRVAPNAACFVVPRVQSWRELRAARNTPVLDWASVERREKAAIFLPSDMPPQEIRDCLHEELAQALGPLNDLYRLPDSVFNDDNMHTILTGFDMLMLRVFYASEMRSGMSRAEVEARLPRVLRRLNPRGERPGGQIPSATSRAWQANIETALGDQARTPLRRQAAARAIAIGQQQGWTGPREGFGHYIYGRLQIGNDATLALGAFNAAARSYRQSSVTEIQAAHVAAQLAAFTLIAGDAEQTLALTRNAIPAARRHENAALLAILMMFQAEALGLQGKQDEAMAVRLDSLGWGLYGFGDRDAVIDRLNEIASLTPDKPPS